MIRGHKWIISCIFSVLSSIFLQVIKLNLVSIIEYVLKFVIFLILQSKIHDLDMNQHVNHVKYIDWLLEVREYFKFSEVMKSIVCLAYIHIHKCICICTCVHTYIYKYMHTYTTHTHLHIQTYVYMHEYLHMQMQHIHMQIQVCIYTYTCSYRYVTRIQIQKCM